MSDLKFSLGTSYLLEGSPKHIPIALDIMKEVLESCTDDHFKGFVHNNIGMGNLFHFVVKTQESSLEQKSKLDDMLVLVPMIEAAIDNLKQSVSTFEQFDKRFGHLTST